MNRLQLALKALFGNYTSVPTNIPVGVSYEQVNAQIVISPDNKQSFYNNAYSVNDNIYSIVELICNKVAIAQWDVYKVDDATALKQYRGIMQRKDLNGEDYKKALQLRKKALQPYQDKVLNKLLEDPNDYCTFSELVANSSRFKLITGDRFLWANILDGGANQGKPQSLYVLPAQFMNIVVAFSGFPMRPAGYQLTMFANTPIATFSLNSVLHDKYDNPTFSPNGSHLYGLSPLKAALLRTDRSNASNKAALASFYNGGARGIVFTKSGTTKFGEINVNKLKNTLTSGEYRGMDAQNKLAFADGDIGYIPIGLSPVDMDIIASEQWDLRTFCNIFGGVSSSLLNDPATRTFNNQKEGEKSLTTRTALPQLNSFRDAFNRMLINYWGYDASVYIDYDPAIFSELQEDMGAKWTWVRELPVTNKYKLDMMGLDYEPGQDGLEMIMVPNTLVNIDDLTAPTSDTTDILNNFSGNGNGQTNRTNGRAVAVN